MRVSLGEGSLSLRRAVELLHQFHKICESTGNRVVKKIERLAVV